MVERLESEALEGVIEKDWFPKSWNNESKKKIIFISKGIDDLNRAIKYTEDPRVIVNKRQFKTLIKVIHDESENLSNHFATLSSLNLDGLGEFANESF